MITALTVWVLKEGVYETTLWVKAYFLLGEIIMNKFAIDSGLFVEKSSLCEGRMAFHSFSKTVRRDRESAVSSW